MTILLKFTRVVYVEDQRAQRLSQALVHLVTARASLFTDHRMPGLLMRAKYKHVKTT